MTLGSSQILASLRTVSSGSKRFICSALQTSTGIDKGTTTRCRYGLHNSRSEPTLSSRYHGVMQCSRLQSSTSSQDQWEEEQYLDQINQDCKMLFSNPEYFKTPVIMFHFMYTSFAVSIHRHDKLQELDAIWSTFPSDHDYHGTMERLSECCVKTLVESAYRKLGDLGYTKVRIAFKGFNAGIGNISLNYLDTLNRNGHITFLSITDMSRRIGEESVVYQRPVPRYPLYKKPFQDMPTEKEQRTKLDKFRSLNVTLYDTSPFARKKNVSSTESSPVDITRMAGKKGFIKKKSELNNQGRRNIGKGLLKALDLD